MLKTQDFITKSTISFGGYNWRVLDTQKDAALILCENTIEERAYNPSGSAVWAECELRGYLNNMFYHEFSPQDKARIAETRLTTGDNPWLGTKGGNDTSDRIFLLSIEDVVEYFGDSGQLKNKNPNSIYWINDQYNSTRIAKDAHGAASWWWLRSPGLHRNTAAYVNTGGSFNLAGHRCYNTGGGVRPALWLKP